MLAYCGLNCITCPIHLATIESDKIRQKAMRLAIVEEYMRQYRMSLQLQDITDCDGCRTNTGRLFSGCVDCEIRKCATARDLQNCAYCVDYICEKLRKHFLMDPGAEKRLEKIRAGNR